MIFRHKTKDKLNQLPFDFVATSQQVIVVSRKRPVASRYRRWFILADTICSFCLLAMGYYGTFWLGNRSISHSAVIMESDYAANQFALEMHDLEGNPVSRFVACSANAAARKNGVGENRQGGVRGTFFIGTTSF